MRHHDGVTIAPLVLVVEDEPPIAERAGAA
jgi:hypothetical protein